MLAAAGAQEVLVLAERLVARALRPRLGLGQKPLLAVEAELVVERLEADLEELGGARLVVVGLLERAQDHAPLDLLDGRADRERERVLAARALALLQRVGREVVALDGLARADDDGALDDVA